MQLEDIISDHVNLKMSMQAIYDELYDDGYQGL